MEIQEQLTFFQELLLKYYSFTMENGVYAIFLGLSVWLVTAILYSFSIAGLNKKIRIQTKLYEESQLALDVANANNEVLQAESQNLQIQLSEQHQHNQSLTEQLNEISAQLSNSIVSLSNNPDLGQQGLTAKEGLPIDQLWQRYHAAVKQICENLTSQIKSNQALQETSKADMAKIAEKDLQLQAAQIRTDSLKQQIVKLEVSLQELQTRLTQEQTESEQRISELDQKYQTDLARLAVVEAQYQADHARLTALEQQASQNKNTTIETVTAFEIIKEPEPVTPVIEPIIEEISTPQPEAAIIEEKPTPIVEPIKVEPQKTETKIEEVASSSTSGFGGRFKSLLSNAKHKIDKLDQKLGQRTDLPSEAEEPEFLKEPDVSIAPPVIAAAITPEIEAETIATATNEIKAKSEKPLNKLFGFKKAKEKEPAIEIVTETAPVQVEVINETKSDTGLGGKFKNLLGKAKSTAPSETEPTPKEPEVLPEPEITPDTKTTAKSVKNLFGKLKF